MPVRWPATFLAVGACGVAWGAACGGDRASAVATRSEPILGGAIDSADPAVVAVVARRTRCDQASAPLVCTGTLIAPRVVLTAAHCLVSVPQGFEVYFGAPLGADPKGVYARVADAIADPDWDITTRTHDAGLLILADPAPVKPAAVRTTALDDTFVGTTVRAVGFGVTDPAQPIADGNKRAGTMTVGTLEPLLFRTTPGPALSCSGDSGGPVFAKGASGEELVGIAVSGDESCSSFAKNTRIDAIWSGFVQPNLATIPDVAPAPSPTVLPFDSLCARTCKTADDCPGDLVCSRDFGAHAVCALPGLTVSASFGATCRSDGDCGGATCARIAPSGADACRCSTACAPDPVTKPSTSAQPSSGGGGCSVSSRSSPAAPLGGALPWLAVALLTLVRRPRQRS